MNDVTATRIVTVINPQGLHARPADLLVKLASRFTARIELRKGHERVDGKSILGILTLGADQGSQLVVDATGPDADAAVVAVSDLFARGFDELSTDSAQPSP